MPRGRIRFGIVQSRVSLVDGGAQSVEVYSNTETDYDSFYCIWDSYRSIHPLITIVDPLSQTLMVRSLIDTYRFEGYLPDCRMDLCKGYTQGGSNADVVLADTFVKGFLNDIDWDTGYEAVVKDAEGMNFFRHKYTRDALSLTYIPKLNHLYGQSKAVEDSQAGRPLAISRRMTTIRTG